MKTYPDGQDQGCLDATKYRPGCHGQQTSLPRRPLVEIHQGLRPADQTKYHEALWLDLDGIIEILDDAVGAKGDATQGPEEQHGTGQAVGRLGAPVGPYLGQELDTPQDGADGAQDGGAGGDGGLRGHGGVKVRRGR